MYRLRLREPSAPARLPDVAFFFLVRPSLFPLLGMLRFFAGMVETLLRTLSYWTFIIFFFEDNLAASHFILFFAVNLIPECLRMTKYCITFLVFPVRLYEVL